MRKRVLSFLISIMISSAAFANLLDEEYQSIQHINNLSKVKSHWTDRFFIGASGAAGYAKVGDYGSKKSKSGRFLHNFTLDMSLKTSDKTSLNVRHNLVNGYGPLLSLIEEATIEGKQIIEYSDLFSMSFKLGRFDLAFGEEYLIQHPADNLMMNLSAAFPWASDEGLYLYGQLGYLGWGLGVFDGFADHDSDDHSDKSLLLKLSYDYRDVFYLSGSYFNNGRTKTPEFWYNFSRAKTGSTNDLGDFKTWEINLKGQLTDDLHFWGNYGEGDIKNLNDHSKNTKVSYFLVRPTYFLPKSFYLVASYSMFNVKNEKSLTLKHFHFGEQGDMKEYKYMAFAFGKNIQKIRIKIEVGQQRSIFAAGTKPNGYKYPIFFGFEISGKY